MNKRHKSAARRTTTAVRLTAICLFLQFSLSAGNLAHADNSAPVAGIIDEPSASSAGLSKKELRKLIKKEQKALRKQNRQQLRKLARKGERLAQVELGSDLASEAQALTFAPAAANDALSEALQWYSLAAKRGYPGAPSLDTSGVTFYPVRVVRNK